MTIFFSSHILGEVQMLCKRVAIIKEGKIIQLEDIENLRKKQLKKVLIEFGDPTEKSKFTLPGMESIIATPDGMLSFMYSGTIEDLVRFLSDRKLINLTIEEPSLDEIFLHYYKN
jgi:ABC-2 type transport system ATP-binding protein